jgi:hypothetical protein
MKGELRVIADSIILIYPVDYPSHKTDSNHCLTLLESNGLQDAKRPADSDTSQCSIISITLGFFLGM